MYESVITTVRPCDKITLKLNGFNWQAFILTHNLKVDLGSLMMEAGLARLVPKLEVRSRSALISVTFLGPVA